MSSTFRTQIILSIALLGLACGPVLLAEERENITDVNPEVMSGEHLFTLKVLPILKEKCQGCHGADPDDLKGDFSVLSREALLRGGETGDPSILIGKPQESYLVSAIKWEDSEMPPKENDRLTPNQISSIERWIKIGAPWPDSKRQAEIRTEAASVVSNEDGRLMETSGGQSDDWTFRRYQEDDLWAFLPLDTTTLNDQEISEDSFIDHLVEQKLNGLQIKPAPEATPTELIRRATYDLTGLPPTYEEVVAFRNHYQADPEEAWRDLIENLLASPRYGEHWGRHWLDVTRYSDTGGMSNDYERSNLWRYRDYVIRSFNSDKPYDQFVREQLAGDELADISLQERMNLNQEQIHQAQQEGDYNEQESEWIVATGFLRLGPWDNAMIESDEARQIYLDDLVNITGQTFLSQTLRCVKCHDHKFDPIPTKDYYRIYSAFGTTQMAERPAPFLTSENQNRFEEEKSHIQKMLAHARSEKNKILEIQETAAKKWYEEHKLPYKTENDRRNDPDEMKPPRHVGLDYVQQGQRKVREQDEWIWNRRLERFIPMAQSVYNADSTILAWNGARMLRINRKKQKGTTTTSNILIGGALTAIGDPVVPGVLSAIALPSNADSNAPYTITQEIDGRRLALANWIANESNPLTTRSIVNRIWQFHFGKGIAANPNNFGAKGAKPSHPVLLDSLAKAFVDGGWSIKSLHRMIMHSATYKRSTRHHEEDKLAELDPNNLYLGKFPRRRLRAEEIRDSILQSTGELRHELGGLPVMPEINMEVALQPRMIQFSIAPAYQPSPRPDTRNRRSIYAYQVRGQADPFSELFNQPNPNESCEMRESAAVTPQTFALLNSDMMNDRAIAAATLIVSRSQNDPQVANDFDDEKYALGTQRINKAFQLILKRNATPDELARLTKYGSRMIAYHHDHQPGETIYPTSITRSLVEEFSGRPFEYEEILPVFQSYQPDIKANQVPAETRAMADICLLLFNTNEFIYVE